MFAISKATKALSAPTGAVESFAADMPTREAAGFRMEGSPQIEVVFGDIALYKQHIDTYRQLHQDMRATRASFSKASHKVQRALAVKRRARRGCPVDDIALSYAEASESGLRFHRLGAKLETIYQAIRELDELGESAGLTPDYRWHVRSSKRVYRAALTDLREMRSVFSRQIEAEARVRGCNGQALLVRAAVLRDENSKEASPAELDGADVASPESTSPQVVASTATFFVNNEACSDPLRVYVDNTLLGEVAPDSRVAFQALAGRHTICILAAQDNKDCGDSGTVRTAFVHDGFAMSRTCATSD